MDLTKPLIPERVTRYSDYSQVPWLRKSGTNSILIVLHLLTLGMLPFLLVTCIMLVTGDIYYNKLDEDGTLKKWSMANKVVAWILLIPPLLFTTALLVAILAGIVRGALQ